MTNWEGSIDKISRDMPSGTKEKHQRPQSGHLVSQSKINPTTSQVKVTTTWTHAAKLKKYEHINK
jgi:hypothetical protein